MVRLKHTDAGCEELADEEFTLRTVQSGRLGCTRRASRAPRSVAAAEGTAIGNGSKVLKVPVAA